jgi:hypothetical protein
MRGSLWPPHADKLLAYRESGTPRRSRGFGAAGPAMGLSLVFLVVYYDQAILKNTPNLEVDPQAIGAPTMRAWPGGFHGEFVFMHPDPMNGAAHTWRLLLVGNHHHHSARPRRDRDRDPPLWPQRYPLAELAFQARGWRYDVRERRRERRRFAVFPRPVRRGIGRRAGAGGLIQETTIVMPMRTPAMIPTATPVRKMIISTSLREAPLVRWIIGRARPGWSSRSRLPYASRGRERIAVWLYF